MLRRRVFSLVVAVFDLLFIIAFMTVARAETKPSCAACLSTARAVDRALSRSMGEEEDSHQQQNQQQQQRRRGRSFPAFFASEPAVASALTAEQRCTEVPRRHRRACASLLAAHRARLGDFFLNASPPSISSSSSHRRHQKLPSCTEELCVSLSGACRPHEVSGEL